MQCCPDLGQQSHTSHLVCLHGNVYLRACLVMTPDHATHDHMCMDKVQQQL